MGKQELINQIREILPVMDKMETHMTNVAGIEQRIDYLNNVVNEMKPFHFMTDGVWGVFVGAVFATFLHDFLGFSDTLRFILVIAFSIGGVYLNRRIACAIWEKNKEGSRKELERRRQNLAEAEKAMVDEIAPYWSTVLDIIPEDYASPLCVKQVYSYLVNGRADNLKEALNLFEEEQHRWRMEEGQRQMYEQYQFEMQSIREIQANMEERLTNAEWAANSAYAMAASRDH